MSNPARHAAHSTMFDPTATNTVASASMSGIELELLQSFVPLNKLSDDHLESLLRDVEVEYLCAGQTLFEAGESDNKHIYLLHGELQLSDVSGRSEVLSAESMMCTYPVAHSQPRSNSAVALTDCSLLRFDSDQLDGIVAWEQIVSYILLDISSRRELDSDVAWMTTLLRSNLFYKVPPINIAQILHRFNEVEVKAGDVILRQGEIGDCCYVIKSGEADVYRATDERSRQNCVARLGPGRCFGEDALINNALRNATIRMNTDGSLMRLGKQDFYLLLREPKVVNLNLSAASDAMNGGAQWIDVRTQEEFEAGHCDSALHLPLEILQLKTRMLDKSKQYVTYCNSGRRSQAAAYFLQSLGFDVCALSGGFKRYSADAREKHLRLCF